MKKTDVESILLMNNFLTSHKSSDECCYFVKKIINSKIDTIISEKSNPSLILWMLGFILSGRFGLWN